MKTEDKLNQQHNQADPEKRKAPDSTSGTPLNGKVNANPMRAAVNKKDSPVQNPNRNLAKGGNNTPYKKK
ncbi:MAG: hypothetical protein LPJ89_02995 [Hymenobacteraceae bacterium]|nr:hypothetical protein [Hymenobacteraceae bacterium]MDX5396932.1 hypothetical protein [Hymenobacteraceae bacterium]MDX5442732.1 hypothetical protein [Hymenobacteraceae bacterium]MDX5513006.1 hypothetical protein [Hymenobacteraceae bacterium]